MNANDPTPDAAANPKTWFKVLVSGASCHGGDTAWSLPKSDGTPGDWHEIPADQQLRRCSVGFHLTDQPIHWFQSGCAIYVAEFEGETTGYDESDRKMAVRRVRLARPATAAELFAHSIFTEGVVRVGAGLAVASGSSQVTASGSSQVTAFGSSQVTASGSSQVTAFDSSQVTAFGSSQVTAFGSSQVTAFGSSQVTAFGSSQVTAFGSSQVTAFGSSQVTAFGSSQVTAFDSSQVTAFGSSQVTAFDSSQVTAKDRVTVFKRTLQAAVSLIGLAVEVDWTGDRAEFRRAEGAPAKS